MKFHFIPENLKIEDQSNSLNIEYFVDLNNFLLLNHKIEIKMKFSFILKKVEQIKDRRYVF